MTAMYGISNCDTVRKAKKWLLAEDIDFTFHDYRKDGIDEVWLKNVATHISWEILLNKRGTTFRQLSDDKKINLDEDKALSLMIENPAMIKRPLLEYNGRYLCGFTPVSYQELMNK